MRTLDLEMVSQKYQVVLVVKKKTCLPMQET